MRAGLARRRRAPRARALGQEQPQLAPPPAERQIERGAEHHVARRIEQHPGGARILEHGAEAKSLDLRAQGVILEETGKAFERAVEQRRGHRGVGGGEGARLGGHLGDLQHGLHLGQTGDEIAVERDEPHHPIRSVKQKQQRFGRQLRDDAVLIEMLLIDRMGDKCEIPQHIGGA